MKKFVGIISRLYLQIMTLALAAPALAVPVPETQPITSGNLKTMIANIVDVVAGLAGIIAVLFLVYGGIMYIVGGETGNKAGRAIITNALIGLAVVVLSYLIVRFLLGALGVGGGSF